MSSKMNFKIYNINKIYIIGGSGGLSLERIAAFELVVANIKNKDNKKTSVKKMDDEKLN